MKFVGKSSWTNSSGKSLQKGASLGVTSNVFTFLGSAIIVTRFYTFRYVSNISRDLYDYAKSVPICFMGAIKVFDFEFEVYII